MLRLRPGLEWEVKDSNDCNLELDLGYGTGEGGLVGGESRWARRRGKCRFGMTPGLIRWAGALRCRGFRDQLPDVEEEGDQEG